MYYIDENVIVTLIKQETATEILLLGKHVLLACDKRKTNKLKASTINI